MIPDIINHLVKNIFYCYLSLLQDIETLSKQIANP